MMHSFSVRIPLAGTEKAPLIEPIRLSRMRDQGWNVSQPVAGVDVAVSGVASLCETAEWMAIGLAFLEDRASEQQRLGLSALDGKSDLEFFLHLRATLGSEFVRDIAGSFSVVFIHRKTGTFEAYRDHFGLYPFYHTLSDGALTCASDLRACLHLSGREIIADPVRVADFIHGDDIDVDRTAFKDVSRLPPAHQLVPGPEGVSAQRYWKFETLIKPYSGPDAPAELRTALKNATVASMKVNGPVGAMLSGGLDSTSLVGLAAAETTDLQTLSFVYGQDKAYDETRYIDAANKAFKTVPHKIPIAAGTALDALGPVVEEQMDLFLAPGLPKSRQIYAEAHALGLNGLIDGHGGDEAISHGYGRLVELAHARRFSALLREARGAARVHGVPLIALVAGHIAQYGGLRPRHPLRRLLMKAARVLTRRSLVSNWSENADSLIAADLRSSVDARTRYARNPILKSESDFQQAAQITHLESLTTPLIVQSFEVLHRSATAAGVLPRYPFLDRRVTSLCLSLPADQKLRDGRSRWVLREAMLGVLPDGIRLRVDKAEFGNELKDTVIAFFKDADANCFVTLAPFIDVASADHLRERVVSGAVTDVAAIRALWRLAVLIHWIEALKRWRDAQVEGMLI
ncbi:MAG: asparagine synthase-related protein [Paracoccaceae bacterium]|nr:asparagine synthase-related protein [Paracoccaceae bacterium]